MGADNRPRFRDFPPLTPPDPREREIVSWLGEDFTYDQIDRRLNVSGHVVRKHAQSL